MCSIHKSLNGCAIVIWMVKISITWTEKQIVLETIDTRLKYINWIGVRMQSNTQPNVKLNVCSFVHETSKIQYVFNAVSGHWFHTYRQTFTAHTQSMCANAVPGLACLHQNLAFVQLKWRALLFRNCWLIFFALFNFLHFGRVCFWWTGIRSNYRKLEFFTMKFGIKCKRKIRFLCRSYDRLRNRNGMEW